MAVNKRIGLGILLAVDTAGGTTFVNLGAIVTAPSSSEAKADTAELTLLNDIIKEKAKGQIDPGEVTFQIAYDPDEASTTLLKTMLETIPTTPPNWRITFPAGTLGAGTITTKTFTAHMTGMGEEFEKDKMLICPITLTKTGQTGF